MKQTKLGSLTEAIFNVLIGSVVSLFSQIAIFPIYDMNPSLETNLAITAWFTAVSVIRSYLVRRFFNGFVRSAAIKLAQAQSKKVSFIEALFNMAIGTVVAFSSQLVIFPMYDMNPTIDVNIMITLWFTGISLVRGYFIRRFFNQRLKAAAMKLASLHNG